MITYPHIQKPVLRRPLEPGRLSEAGVVRKYASDLAELVVSGSMFLTDAYAEARKRKEMAEGQAAADARALKETNARTARPRERAPDLADQVAEWRLWPGSIRSASSCPRTYSVAT